MAAGERHPDANELSAEEAEAIERIARHVEDDPTDVMARKQYAVALLSTGQFFAAFEQAEILLASDGGDPDGLYVKGMVRMRMGQEVEARSLLERLVASYPEHVPALTALGVLVLRSGGLEAAEAHWEQAIIASGGANAEVEQLREAARRQVAAGAVPAANPSESTPQTAMAPRPDGYTLLIDLAPGASGGAGVLFVSLRQGEEGPPAAVKRIANPTFPLTVTLSAADSMLGRPLPANGTVSARLDADGNVSTRVDGEPGAQVTMSVGETANLSLQ
jgi:cytochrome c-type biogenesis protein CcmH